MSFKSSYCNICNNKSDKTYYLCKICNSVKCLICESLNDEIIRWPTSLYFNHYYSHDIADIPKVDTKIICCIDEYNGCNTINDYTNNNCTQCNRKLWTTTTNNGRHLGEFVYFLQKKCGLPSKGIIVDIDKDIVTVRYLESTYRFKAYDEKFSVDQVYTSIEEASSIKRNRNSIKNSTESIKNLPEQVITKSNSDTKKSKRPINSRPIMIDLDSPNISSPLVSTTTITSNNTSKDIKSDITSLISSSSSDASIKVKKVKENIKINHSITEFYNIRFDDFNLDELLNIVVIRPIDIPNINPLIDQYIQQGLLYVLYNWAKPPLTLAQIEELGGYEAIKKPKLTITALEDILQILPITTNELNNIDSCKHLLDLATKQTTNYSYGDELIDIITNYLSSRQRLPKLIDKYNFNCNMDTQPSIESLKQLHLQIPLSFDQFKAVMTLAYSKLGGRRYVESNIGGSIHLNGVKTMYGGVMEDFIEKQLVQRLRIGKDDYFVDIGSGIAQVCIQIAATVGCISYGIEIIQSRHDTGSRLLNAFDSILDEVNAKGRLSSVVKLVHGDFAYDNELYNASKIFFNNFGKWFESPDPGSQIDYCHEFCDKIKRMKMGVEISCLSPLVQATHWLHQTTYKSNSNDFTWTSHPVDVYIYTKNSDTWTCDKCTYLNDLDMEYCGVCYKKPQYKRLKSIGRSK